MSGRPSVRLVPVAPQAWRTYAEVADIFRGPADTEWQSDRDQIDQQLRDPWTPA